MDFRFVLAVLSIMLTGCVGAFVPVQTVEMTGLRVAETAGAIAVKQSGTEQGMQNVGEVVGHSCRNKIWDHEATAEAALFQVKLAATQRGAVAISNLRCVELNTSLATNCWQSFECRATAYR